MKLDLNFSTMTKLRDWWKQVYNNFEIIESECRKTRTLADNACTKEQAQAYVAEFAGASEEYMEAMTAFNELYKESGSATDALEEIFGERVAKTEYDEHCGDAQIHHTHQNKTALDEITNEKINEWDTKSDVVFGTYTGTYVSTDATTEMQFINLGFTPSDVEVYAADGGQMTYNAYSYSYSGGFALTENPCTVMAVDKQVIFLEIVENGFNVYSGNYGKSNKSYYWSLNTGLHYFKAYKSGVVVEV